MKSRIHPINYFHLAGVLLLLAPQAQTAPVDLVEYNGSKTGFILRVEPSPKGNLIVGYACPANIQVKAFSDCAPTGRALLPVDLLKPFVRTVFLNWAYRHPGEGLAPLKADELELFKAHPKYPQEVAELARLEEELIDLDAMLEKLPASAPYLKQKAAKTKRIEYLKTNTAPSQIVEEAVGALSDSILELIAKNNPEDQLPNSYQRSKMLKTLIPAVAEKLFHSFEWADHELIKTTPPGKYFEARVNANGTYDLLTIRPKEVFKRHSAIDPVAVHSMAEFIRTNTAANNW